MSSTSEKSLNDSVDTETVVSQFPDPFGSGPAKHPDDVANAEPLSRAGHGRKDLLGGLRGIELLPGRQRQTSQAPQSVLLPSFAEVAQQVALCGNSRNSQNSTTLASLSRDRRRSISSSIWSMK